MKRTMILIGCFWAGVVLGTLCALWSGGALAGAPQMGRPVDVGGWQSDWAIGTDKPGGSARARMARHSLLSTDKRDLVHFTKAVDDLGAELVEGCTYRVSGRAMPADWWSITLYDEDKRLPLNGDNKPAFDAGDMSEPAPGAVEDWSFLVRATPPETAADDVAPPWVSSRSAGAFSLVLRLYGPTEALIKHPKRELRTPTIERLGCGEGGA